VSPASPSLKTKPETTSAVRILVQELWAEVGGPRLTQDMVISAMAKVARNHRDEMIELLRPA
jgi:hypothetical protein